MKTLIIYNLIPDDILFFIVPDQELKPEWQKMLEIAHGKCANIDEYNNGMDWLSFAAASKEEYCSDNIPKEFHCCLRPYKTTVKETLSGPFSKTYYSGYLL